MTLGERLKQARLEAGLSQRQLGEGIVTRNMLSLLESGSAKPSMDTLAALAARLGKPVGWFLGEDAASGNQKTLEAAREKYVREEYESALNLLENWKPDGVFDQEKGLLECLCLLGFSRQMAREKPRYALALLERAEKCETVYRTFLERELTLCRYALTGEARGVLQDDRELLLRGQQAMDAGQSEKAAGVLETAEKSPARQLLLGQALMAMGEYAPAARALHEAESFDPRRCVPLLEQCYRELEDYKMAYAYACKMREKN